MPVDRCMLSFGHEPMVPDSLQVAIRGLPVVHLRARMGRKLSR
jgi:hypothetical protein